MFTFQLCSLNCIKCMAWGDSIPTAQDWSWPCTCTVPIVTQQPQHTDLSESRWCRRSLCSRGAQEASRAAALPEPSSDGLDCSWRWSPERDREWSRGSTTAKYSYRHTVTGEELFSVIYLVSKCVDVSVHQKTADGTHFKSLDNCRVQRKPVGPSTDFKPCRWKTPAVSPPMNETSDFKKLFVVVKQNIYINNYF